ncbi:Cadherin-23 [Sparganum proliferum]
MLNPNRVDKTRRCTKRASVKGLRQPPAAYAVRGAGVAHSLRDTPIVKSKSDSVKDKPTNGGYPSVHKGMIATLFAILLVIISRAAFCATASNEFIADLFLTLKYSNPENRLEDNEPCDLWITDLKCDVYFEVCVSSDANRDCDLLKKSTEIFLEQDQIEMANNGRIVIPIRSSLPRSLWISVAAWDHDTVSTSDLIGDFEIDGSLEYLLEKERSLRPRRKRFASMSMKLELQCRKNWFGKLCETYCNPVADSFTCDENGTAICLPGYVGPSCTRKDYCFIEPCAENAQCENTDVGFRCICDGKEDAKCYASYKPCINETCSENGICKPSPGSADGFKCECKRRWSGKRCEIRLDACEYEERRLQQLDAGATAVCLNNGTCISDPNGLDFQCQCSPGWEGSRCEIRAPQRLAISLSSSIAVLVCLVVIVLLAILIGKKATRKRLLQHGFIYSTKVEQRTMTMPVGGNRTDPDRRSIHIYADIGDPYVLPINGGLDVADNLTPSYLPRQNSDSESPPVVPLRALRKEAQRNERISSTHGARESSQH